MIQLRIIALRRPAYNLKEFETICAKPKSHGVVLVRQEAANDARIDFGLDTRQKVIKFIGSGGLERPRLINSIPWEKNPEPSNKIMVDAYEFYSGRIFDYMAFLYNPIKKIWLIKSFKEHWQDPARNLPFIELDKIRKTFH